MKVTIKLPFNSPNSNKNFIFEVTSLDDLKTIQVFNDCMGIIIKDRVLKKELDDYVCDNLREIITSHWEQFPNATHYPCDGQHFDVQFNTDHLAKMVKTFLKSNNNIYLTVVGTYSQELFLHILARIINKITGYRNNERRDDAFQLAEKLMKDLDFKNNYKPTDSGMRFGRFN